MRQHRFWVKWILPGICLATIGYALAEDLTLTTYYPSPRGVYKELRASGDVAIGTTSAPRVRLEVQGSAGPADVALLITNQASGLTPALSRLAVTNDGQVGLGMRPLSAASPQALIIGTSTGLAGDNTCGSLPWQDEDGDSAYDPGECKQVRMVVTQAGQVGIGTTSPSTMLDINGQVRIRGGNPDTGKVLTATDAAGVASWQVAGGGTTWRRIVMTTVVGPLVTDELPPSCTTANHSCEGLLLRRYQGTVDSVGHFTYLSLDGGAWWAVFNNSNGGRNGIGTNGDSADSSIAEMPSPNSSPCRLYDDGVGLETSISRWVLYGPAETGGTDFDCEVWVSGF